MTKVVEQHSFKYHIHPFFKVIGFIGLNILIFLPVLAPWRWLFFVIEFIAAFFLHLPWRQFLGIGKIIAINFVGILIIFYFAYSDWKLALIEFGNYALTLIIMILGSFLFTASTSPLELVTFFRKFKIPPKYIFAIVIAMTWLPILSQEIRKIVIYQQARGYKLSIFHLGPIIIPAILNLMDLSINLSISLESRGFH